MCGGKTSRRKTNDEKLPVNAVIFWKKKRRKKYPNKTNVPLRCHKLSPALMSQRQNCIGRKGKKEKSRQIKEVSVGESHFEAVLPGGNISPWPEGGRGEEEVVGRGGGVGGGGGERGRVRVGEVGGGGTPRPQLCPQDTHKYPCKLQFKRNQYK